jgi:isopenicillin-N epimerase
VLVVSAEWRERVEPLVVSRRYLDGFPASFDQPGAFDYTGWLAAPVGPQVLRDLGHAAVCRHNTELARYGQEVVAAALRVDPAELPAPSDGVSMSLVPLPPGVADSAEATGVLRQRIYDELKAEVAVFVWEGRAYLRLSAQIYNVTEEYDRLAGGLPAVLRAVG